MGFDMGRYQKSAAQFALLAQLFGSMEPQLAQPQRKRKVGLDRTKPKGWQHKAKRKRQIAKASRRRNRVA